MNSTRPAQSGDGTTMGQVVLPGNREILRGEGSPEQAAVVPPFGLKPRGYGLPCAKCRAYYAADQAECPICKTTERVPPNAVSLVTAGNESAPEDCGDDAALAAERERFLREFKSRVFAQHAMREGLPQQVLYGMEANKQ